MAEHGEIVTHLTKEERRRMVAINTELARAMFTKDEVDVAIIRELRALQLKAAGIKVAEVSG